MASETMVLTTIFHELLLFNLPPEGSPGLVFHPDHPSQRHIVAGGIPLFHHPLGLCELPFCTSGFSPARGRNTEKVDPFPTSLATSI
jgi:hypothetical protein